MDHNCAVQQLYIRCTDSFDEELKTLEDEFLSLGEKTQYCVGVEESSEKSKTNCIFQILFQNPKQNLVKLELSSVTFTVSQLKLITCTQWLSLKSLLIYSSKFDHECALQISRLNTPELKNVEIRKCFLDDIHVSHIIKARWPKLQQINLSYNSITSSGLQHIGYAQWKELKKLICNYNDFSQPFDGAIGEWFDFPNLKLISLNETNTCQSNLSKIDKSKQPMLQVLNVEGCLASGKDLFNLIKNIGWSKLKEAKIKSSTVDKSEFCQGLSNFCLYSLPNLTKLHIKQTYLSKLAIRNFVKAGWEHFTQLKLYQCSLQQESVTVLAKCKWDQLELVSFKENEIGDASIDFVSRAYWPKLVSLHLQNESEDFIEITPFGTLNLTKLSSLPLETVDLEHSLMFSAAVMSEIFE